MVTDRVPGNPWVVTSMWLAQYYALTAKKEKDLEPLVAWLEWGARHSIESGVLAEQLDPATGRWLSATPLTWSHAEYIRTVFAYFDALDRLGICKHCNPIH